MWLYMEGEVDIHTLVFIAVMINVIKATYLAFFIDKQTMDNAKPLALT